MARRLSTKWCSMYALHAGVYSNKVAQYPRYWRPRGPVSDWDQSIELQRPVTICLPQPLLGQDAAPHHNRIKHLSTQIRHPTLIIWPDIPRRYHHSQRGWICLPMDRLSLHHSRLTLGLGEGIRNDGLGLHEQLSKYFCRFRSRRKRWDIQASS